MPSFLEWSKNFQLLMVFQVEAPSNFLGQNLNSFDSSNPLHHSGLLTLSDPGRGYFYPPPLSKFDAISLWIKVEFLTLGGFSS